MSKSRIKRRGQIPQGPCRETSRFGGWPLTYQKLTEQEKKAVQYAFLFFNTLHPSESYFEVDEFYQQEFRPGGWWA